MLNHSGSVIPIFFAIYRSHNKKFSAKSCYPMEDHFENTAVAWPHFRNNYAKMNNQNDYLQL